MKNCFSVSIVICLQSLYVGLFSVLILDHRVTIACSLTNTNRDVTLDEVGTRTGKQRLTQGFPLLFLQLENQVQACIPAVLAADATKKKV